MFSTKQIYGNKLPSFFLSLTFDDGPGISDGRGKGPKTLRLAEYLAKHGIYATFFVVGKYVNQYPDIVFELFRLGHLIGNHTYNHPNLVEAWHTEKDLVSEIVKTDLLIKKYVKNDLIYFRAPYGNWSPQVADYLNTIERFNHKGPFFWDISANDFSYWEKGENEAACADAYMKAIDKIRKGIILMHDSTADNEVMRKNNLTFETIKIIIPKLKDMGYQFVRLDEIPD